MGGWVPKADFGAGSEWVARELQWDAYLLRSASVYEELCGHHTITQGGYYQYSTGLNLGTRSWPHYLLPMVYTEPELAREILRYTIGVQSESGNQFPYGTGPLCTPRRPRDVGRPRLLAPPGGGRVRARRARPRVLRRAAPVLRHAAAGERVGAREARLRAPGEPARTARRLPRRHERRLVGLQHASSCR